jgi:hypothetical protein
MKNKITLLVVTLLLFGTASLASGQKTGKDPKGPLVKLLPDLVVIVNWNKTEGEANVTVKNICKGTSVPTSVIIFVYGTENSTKYTAMLSDGVPVLAPGGSYSHLFSSGYLKSPIKVVVDYEHKVKEAAEGNNWWEPNAQPFPQKGGYCNPPYDK